MGNVRQTGLTGLAALIQTEAEGPCPGGYEGHDWWQLSEAEQEVFEIDPARFPLMVSAWGAYEAFMGRTSGARWDMNHQADLDAAKVERPDIVANADDRNGWADFAAAYAGLTNREAWLWYAKNDAWQARNGILEFLDRS